MNQQHIPDAPPTLQSLLKRLYAETVPEGSDAEGGFLVSQHAIQPTPDAWYAGWAAGDIGPYTSAEDAIIAGVKWLYGLASEANARADLAEREVRALKAALRAVVEELRAEREAKG